MSVAVLSFFDSSSLARWISADPVGSGSSCYPLTLADKRQGQSVIYTHDRWFCTLRSYRVSALDIPRPWIVWNKDSKLTEMCVLACISFFSTVPFLPDVWVSVSDKSHSLAWLKLSSFLSGMPLSTRHCGISGLADCANLCFQKKCLFVYSCKML